jgi:hypothetical protein
MLGSISSRGSRHITVGVPIYVGISAAILAEGSLMSAEHTLADIQGGAVAMLAGGMVLTPAGDALVLWCERRRTAASRQRACDRRLLVSTS